MTVRLGPTGIQLFSAFIWAGIGLTIGIGLVVAAWVGGGIASVQVLGALIIALSVISAVLEWRVLPGVRIDFAEGEVTVTPVAGDPVTIAQHSLQALRVETLEPVRTRGRIRATVDGRRPGEWVFFDESPEPALPKAFRVGLSLSSLEALKAACQAHGIVVKSGF
ncbi:hypothetical protein HMPREF1531_00400 [Propionibacterium sp. oral taxon 192 str. F0372]|uniref:hypothetical protein n=1 Tax=Propionibacterium sp. oral taxon 192 TaxID=671222 RepID=UPI0003536981|nr:hypothetical protein [Propionibacterium sp. oral taxon 192]EPH06798.1 hypothetical protein HMPREF1531_00400 [Propionibacterium sp. oral taxon 192 str. F0372]